MSSRKQLAARRRLNKAPDSRSIQGSVPRGIEDAHRDIAGHISKDSLLKIFGYLTYEDKKRMRLVCKSYDLLLSPILFQNSMIFIEDSFKKKKTLNTLLSAFPQNLSHQMNPTSLCIFYSKRFLEEESFQRWLLNYERKFIGLYLKSGDALTDDTRDNTIHMNHLNNILGYYCSCENVKELDLGNTFVTEQSQTNVATGNRSRRIQSSKLSNLEESSKLSNLQGLRIHPNLFRSFGRSQEMYRGLFKCSHSLKHLEFTGFDEKDYSILEDSLKRDPLIFERLNTLKFASVDLKVLRSLEFISFDELKELSISSYASFVPQPTSQHISLSTLYEGHEDTRITKVMEILKKNRKSLENLTLPYLRCNDYKVQHIFPVMPNLKRFKICSYSGGSALECQWTMIQFIKRFTPKLVSWDGGITTHLKYYEDSEPPLTSRNIESKLQNHIQRLHLPCTYWNPDLLPKIAYDFSCVKDLSVRIMGKENRVFLDRLIVFEFLEVLELYVFPSFEDCPDQIENYPTDFYRVLKSITLIMKRTVLEEEECYPYQVITYRPLYLGFVRQENPRHIMSEL